MIRVQVATGLTVVWPEVVSRERGGVVKHLAAKCPYCVEFASGHELTSKRRSGSRRIAARRFVHLTETPAEISGFKTALIPPARTASAIVEINPAQRACACFAS